MITINSESRDKQVCPYTFKSANESSNAFELKFEDYKDMEIGIYYYSALSNAVIDIGVFIPEACSNVKHCIRSESGYIILMIENAKYAHVNLIPKTR